MRATTARKVSAVVAVLSVVLLGATLLLPGVKLPETERQIVPSWVVTPQQNYQIFGYGIPPVATGTSINVTFHGFQPAQLEYSLSPTNGNEVLTPLAFGEVGGGPEYSFAVTAAQSYSLELTIIAHNGTGYSITIAGVWSPFDWLPVYLSPAVFLLAASLTATYYFGTRIPKQLAEEKVEAELKAET